MTAGSAPRRPDPRIARSRAAVLRACVDLLVERGAAGATIEAVAERAGVAKTTVYRQWPDQAALVRDAFAATLTPYEPPDTGSLRGDLVELVRGLARALAAGPASRLMLGLLDGAERSAALADVHRLEGEARHAAALEVVRRGIRGGELPAGTDPRLVLDLVAGPVFHRRWFGDVPPDADFAEAVVDAVLGGLGAGRDGWAAGAR